MIPRLAALGFPEDCFAGGIFKAYGCCRNLKIASRLADIERRVLYHVSHWKNFIPDINCEDTYVGHTV